jgi:hypothetical protein
MVNAAEASRIFLEHDDGLGLEVIVPKSASITRIHMLTKACG